MSVGALEDEDEVVADILDTDEELLLIMPSGRAS